MTYAAKEILAAKEHKLKQFSKCPWLPSFVEIPGSFVATYLSCQNSKHNQGTENYQMRQEHRIEKLLFMFCLGVSLLGAARDVSAQSTPTQPPATTTIDVWRQGMAGTEQPAPGAATTMTINDEGEVVVPGEDVVQKLTDLEHRWAEAVRRQSKANLSRLLSSDFVFIGESANPSAASVSKQSYVNRVVKEPQAELDKFNVQTIRVYGDTAIVNVRYKPVANGKVAPVEIIVTDVWVKRNNRWQAVTRHTSELNAAPQPNVAPQTAP